MNITKSPRSFFRICMVLLLVLGVLPQTVFGAPNKKNKKKKKDEPAYSKNIHGSQGMIMALKKIVKHDEKYAEPLQKSIEWLLVELVTNKDSITSVEDVKWRYPDGQFPDNRKLLMKVGGGPMIGDFPALYKETKDPIYMNLAKSACLAGIEKAEMEETPWGQGMIPRRIGGKPDFSGTSWGAGKYLMGMIEVYAISPDPKIQQMAEAIVRSYRKYGIVDDSKFGSTIRWPWIAAGKKMKSKEDPDLCETARCYGQGGSIETLLTFHAAFPEFRFSDEMSALDLANQSLRYLMDSSIPKGQGFTWQHPRFLPAYISKNNPGFGSGVAGVGYSFLLGMKANQKAGDKEFAALCKKYAIGAAYQSATMINNLKRLADSGERGQGHGLCGGAMGAGLFFEQLDVAIGEEIPELMEKLRDTGRHMIKLMDENKIEFSAGYGWPTHQTFNGQPAINVAVDYGLTGDVYLLINLYEWLKEPRALELAQGAADFLLSLTVEEPHGLKVAWINPMPQTKKAVKKNEN